MGSFQKLKQGNGKYLLMPTIPTPNGGLHLGHMAGPYLKMDVLARCRRRNGSEASIIFGSDVYESYTTLKAWQTGLSVEAVCNMYHERIRQDMEAINIQYDVYINPLDEAVRDDFNRFLKNSVGDLVAAGVTEVRPEKFLFSPSADHFLVGCWILGKCPLCHSDTGSYQCEECGTQYRPMDLGSPESKIKKTDAIEIHDYDLYLRIDKKQELLERLGRMGIDEEFIQIVETFLRLQGDRVRLTNPGTWGTPWEIPGSGIPHVLFTYTAMNFFSLYCGEIYATKFGAPHNAFHPDSGVTTVASFGIDCSIAYMVGAMSCNIESGKYKPFDFLLPNYFYRLEDAKFSTSRGHLIGTSDIVRKTPAGADAVRYFLVRNNPEHKGCNFKINDFMEFVNEELAGRLQPLLERTWANITQPPGEGIPENLVVKLENLLIEQDAWLCPPGFELEKGSLALIEWIALHPVFSVGSDGAYWWLKGFALLAYPIMPHCADSVWTLLGHTGFPVERDFFKIPPLQSNVRLPVFFNQLNLEQLLPSLPETLSPKGIRV